MKVQTNLPYVHKYIRDEFNNPVGVLIGVKQDGKILYGWSLCHQKTKTMPREPFSREMGITIAYGRAVSKRKHLVPKGRIAPSDMLNFINMCEAKAERGTF